MHMQQHYENAVQWLERFPYLYNLLALVLLLFAAWLANWLIKRVLVRGFYRMLRATHLGQDKALARSHIISRLANVVPALILASGIELIPDLPKGLITVTRNVCGAFIVLTLALAVSGTLTLANSFYERRPDAHLRPLKGYFQIVKIAIYVIATVLIIATLVDRSPLILLSGLGAMAAVLILIFQDTLLSLVASVQISSNDIVRVGDWIEMPQLNADGDVIDIALHTIKVQNWDKTITTIPTKRFITDSFKNWRGMQEAGGRRIKRSIYLDQNSVHFLSPEEIDHLRQFKLLAPYLKSKESELLSWNSQLEEPQRVAVNTRRVTNIGTFRAYVENYLRQHQGIRQDMTLLVRQLGSTADGLPLEFYCFTNTTAWVAYEAIQSDIFDHMLAIIPEFGLRVFQHPSGADMRVYQAALSNHRNLD